MYLKLVQSDKLTDQIDFYYEQDTNMGDIEYARHALYMYCGWMRFYPPFLPTQLCSYEKAEISKIYQVYIQVKPYRFSIATYSRLVFIFRTGTKPNQQLLQQQMQWQFQQKSQKKNEKVQFVSCHCHGGWITKIQDNHAGNHCER